MARLLMCGVGSDGGWVLCDEPSGHHEFARAQYTYGRLSGPCLALTMPQRGWGTAPLALGRRVKGLGPCLWLGSLSCLCPGCTPYS